MWLLLDDRDVRSVLTMRAAIDSVRDAYRALGAGEAVSGERVRLVLPNGWVRISPAALIGDGIVGYKEFHEAADHGVRYTINLFAYETGQLLASMDGTAITIMRTGATGGFAVQAMTDASFRWAGVIGSGVEARAQLEAIVEVCRLEGATVFSPSPESRLRFAQAVAEELSIEVHTANSGREAVSDGDLIVVATDTKGRGPAFKGSWIPDRPGVHINSIGSTMPKQRELDTDAWGRAGVVVIDAPTLLEESGDAIAAEEAGTLDRQRVINLSEFARDAAPPAIERNAPTMFKSVGQAIQDIAVAARVYELAVERRLGRWMEDYLTLKP